MSAVREFPIPERSKWKSHTPHDGATYPCEACCGKCRDAGNCWVCGKPTTAATGRCTSGACGACHDGRAHEPEGA